MDFHLDMPLYMGPPPPPHLGQPMRPHFLHVWSVLPASPSEPTSVLPGTRKSGPRTLSIPPGPSRPLHHHGTPRSPQPFECLKALPLQPPPPGDSCWGGGGAPRSTFKHPNCPPWHPGSQDNPPAHAGWRHSSLLLHPPFTISTKPGLSSPTCMVAVT